MIVIHTGETDPDLNGLDRSAERLSAFMGNDKESRVAWHATVDSDSVLHELPTKWTGAHVKNWNSATIGIELGTSHNLWSRMPADHTEKMIRNLARTVAWMCRNHDLPTRLVSSLEAARSGRTGLVAHSTLDPARRSDPGPDFPWNQLLDEVQSILSEAPEIVGIGDSGAHVTKAQRALHDLGYEQQVGVIDGVAGSLFDDAVRAYERDMGASQTGLWAGPIGAPARPKEPAAGGAISIGDSVGRGGQNRSGDVATIKSRLDELGFLIDGRPLEHSIRLFQAAKDGGQTVNRKDGRVDPGGDTLAWLNASNAPRWVHMPAGSEPEGFKSRERTQVSDDHGWGTSWLADTLRGAAAKYQQDYRRGRQNIPLIWSNDASPKRGGDTPDHAGHEAGMQLDIVLPPGSARSRRITVDDDTYDQEAARSMLKAFRAQGNIRAIFLNDRQLIAEGLCSYSGGHEDHIHIHIDPPGRTEGSKPPRGLNIDWAFIRTLEGFEVEGYVPNNGGRVIGQSGVTIGSGFDLGQHNGRYAVRLGVPERIVKILRPYFGLKGQPALQFERANPLRLPEADVLLVDELVKTDKATGVMRVYDRDSRVPFVSLPAAAQTVITSVLFQYGSAGRVPKFWRYSTSRSWGQMIAELRDFGDRYGSRRRKEAAYLERGLSGGPGAQMLWLEDSPEEDLFFHTLQRPDEHEFLGAEWMEDVPAETNDGSSDYAGHGGLYPVDTSADQEPEQLLC